MRRPAPFVLALWLWGCGDDAPPGPGDAGSSARSDAGLCGSLGHECREDVDCDPTHECVSIVAGQPGVCSPPRPVWTRLCGGLSGQTCEAGERCVTSAVMTDSGQCIAPDDLACLCAIPRWREAIDCSE